MSREIKFRGKDVSDGTWAYGGFYISAGGNAIIVSEDGWIPSYNDPDSGSSNIFTNVFYKTLCQYTGLKDKNGKEIYEGDILEYKRSSRLLTDTVRFSNAAFWCGFHDGSSTKKRIKLIQPNRVEIIGNIHENH